jgi:hypothetical protein
VRIGAIIADWPRLLQHQERYGEDFGAAEESWYRANAFTRCNDSCVLNTAVGELFIDIRKELPSDDVDRLGEFLAAVCPVVAEEGPYPIPTAPGVFHEKFYSSLAPDEVDRRLALLESVDLPGFFACAGRQLEQYPGCPLRGQVEKVIEFIFMWAAAFGLAAGKGWGLIVAFD